MLAPYVCWFQHMVAEIAGAKYWSHLKNAKMKAIGGFAKAR